MFGRLTILLGALISLSLTTSPVAQPVLAETEWIESISLRGDDSSSQKNGLDPAVPEVIDAFLTAPGGTNEYGMWGNIRFGPPGPPQAMAEVDAMYTTGLNEFMTGSAVAGIIFEFWVKQTSTPPSSPGVPVTIRSRGSAEVTGHAPLNPTASASIEFFSIVHQVVANINTPAASFDETDRVVLDVGGPSEPVRVTLSARAMFSMFSLQGFSSAFALGLIDPIIEVADEIIPGTGGLNYRSFYEVEFGPGYWALGVPSAAEPTTWGRIKSMYGN